MHDAQPVMSSFDVSKTRGRALCPGSVMQAGSSFQEQIESQQQQPLSWTFGNAQHKQWFVRHNKSRQFSPCLASLSAAAITASASGPGTGSYNGTEHLTYLPVATLKGRCSLSHKDATKHSRFMLTKQHRAVVLQHILVYQTIAGTIPTL